ncbi:hypothetical protein AAFF_G00185910 [Aldrovandia affinis]|uniref:Reverse transcriptase n=1 Tax=Aldrovandia affinis TaxID=143900 RepID=A0AAD7RK01_9TELE|nr:hypothetical protein AAFF_G00185910 [Aldrovandia affinis]
MAAAGVIKSCRPCKKKDNSWHFCVDYRRLNAVTRKDSYPLPCIDDALDHISGSRWFSSGVEPRSQAALHRLSGRPSRPRRRLQVARWLETLQGYNFELRHRPGRQQ